MRLGALAYSLRWLLLVVASSIIFADSAARGPNDLDLLLLVLPGLVLAVAFRWGRMRAGTYLDRWLKPLGHVGASMAADLIAGVGTAAVFALKP